MFLSFMGDEADESKCLFLPFLYFSSFVMFISLSRKDCRKVLYHRPQELPHFLPSPNASLPLERATKVSPFFLVCFVENTVLHQYWFWNGSCCGWSLICLSVLCPRSWPLHALGEHGSQLHKVSSRLLLFPPQVAWGVWAGCFAAFCFRPSRSPFSIIRVTLELKDTFQGRLLMLRNLSLMRGRNLSLPN